MVNQNVDFTGLNVPVNIGTAKVNLQIRLTGKAGTISIGTGTLRRQVSLGGLNVPINIGTPYLILSILPTGVEVSVYS